MLPPTLLVFRALLLKRQSLRGLFSASLCDVILAVILCKCPTNVTVWPAGLPPAQKHHTMWTGNLITTTIPPPITKPYPKSKIKSQNVSGWLSDGNCWRARRNIRIHFGRGQFWQSVFAYSRANLSFISVKGKYIAVSKMSNYCEASNGNCFEIPVSHFF